jgi:hypothetical protein
MEKAFMAGAAIAYLIFIALTAWIIMIGLDVMEISVPYLSMFLLLIAARFAYVVIKGNIIDE